MTWLTGLLLSTVVKSTSSPRLCSESAASVASRPTTFGTATFLPSTNTKYAPTASASRTITPSAHIHQRERASSSSTHGSPGAGSITIGRVGARIATSSAAMNSSAVW